MAGIALGTIYGDVRLALDGLRADVDGATSLFDTLKAALDNFTAGLNLAAPIEEQLGAVNAAMEDTGLAQMSLWDSMTTGAEEAATAVEDGMAQVDEAVGAGSDDAGSALSMFAQRVRDSLSAAGESLGGFAGKAQSAFAQVMDGSETMGKGVGGLTEGLGGLSDSLLGGIGHIADFGVQMLEFQAMFGATEAVGKFAGSLIGMNTEFEALHQQLTSITGSSGQADQILTWVKQFGQQVPDTTEHLAQAVVTIQSLGLNAQQVMPSLANVAAAMGTDLPTAAQAFADAYLGRWQMMQMELHVNKEELVQYGLQLDKSGHILNNSLVPAFERFSKAKFGNAIHNQMQTLQGQLSNLTDRVQFFAMALGKPLFDTAKQGLGALFGWLDAHKAQVDAFANTVGKGLADAFKALGGFVAGIPKHLQDIADHFKAAFDDKNGQKVKGLKDLAHDLGTQLKSLGDWVKANLMPALDTLATVAGVVAGKISGFIEFLQTHDSAMTGFKAALVTLGVILIGPVVAGFVATGIAAAGAAVGVVAATWPVLAIVAAVALLVMGIKLLINHWGDIQKFFGNLKKAVGDALGHLGEWIGGKLADAGKAIGGFFSGLGTWIHDHLMQLRDAIQAKILEIKVRAEQGFHQFIEGVKTVLKVGLLAILGIIFAPIVAIVGLFLWLYNHNYYFKALVDAIRQHIQQGFAWVTGHIKEAVTWIVTHFEMLKDEAEVKWEELRLAIVKVVTAVHQWLVDRITTVQNWLHDRWTDIQNDVKAAFLLVYTNIITPVQNAWKWVQSTVGGWAKWLGDRWRDIVSTVTTWWSNFLTAVQNGVKTAKDWIQNNLIAPLNNMLNLGKQAYQWGINLLTMFANGIKDSAGKVKDAALGALGGLAKVMGFHSPAEEGPGADADKWAPNLMTMYAQGIRNGTPGVVAAALGATSGLADGLSAYSPASLDATGGSLGGGGDGSLGGAGGSGTSIQTLNLTVEVTTDGSDASDPASAGEAFGRSLGAALNTALAQRGYN